MKRFLNYSIGLLTLLLMLSCGRDQNSYPNPTPDVPEDENSKGYLTLPATFNISVSVAAENAFASVESGTAAAQTQTATAKAAQTQTATETVTKASTEAAPDTYIIEILRKKSASTETFFHGTYGEFKAKVAEETNKLKLTVGNYTITARSAESNEGAGFDAAYYESEPIAFSITKDKETTISNVICKLKNVKVTVGLSADLMDMFQSDVICKVTLTPNSLTYDKSAMSGATVDDLATGYFAPTLGEETMAVELSGNYNTAAGDETPSYSPVKMTKTLSNIKAGQWRKVTISVQHVSDGTVTFTITCQTWMEDENIVVDVQSTKFAFVGEELIPEDASKIVLWANNAATEGTLNLSESMFTGTSCNTPVAVQIKATSPIAAYQVSWNSTNADMLTDYGLHYSNPIDLISPTANDIKWLDRDMPNIPYGSELLNQTEVTFSVAPYLYNLFAYYPGTHTLTNTMTDNKGVVTTSVLTLVVPEPTTGGPSVVWSGHDFGTRYTIDPTSGLSVVIDITSETGITGFTVDISGDVLTAKDLQDLKLDSHMDLIDPATTDMKSGLSGLGFPVGDEVLNQKNIHLDITQFMPMLLILGRTGDQNFQLKVTDASGTSTKTIMVKVE